MKDDLDLLWLAALAVVGWLLWNRFGRAPAGAGAAPAPGRRSFLNPDEQSGQELANDACLVATKGQGGSLCQQISNLAPVRKIGTDFVNAWDGLNGCNYKINGLCVDEREYCLKALLPLGAGALSIPEFLRPDCGPYEAEARQKGIIE